MPVLLDSPDCAALRADMKEDRLNSRFQHIRENKSVKTHWLCKKNRLSFKINVVF